MSERLTLPGASAARRGALSRRDRPDWRGPSGYASGHRGRPQDPGQAGFRRLPAGEHRQRQPRVLYTIGTIARIGQLQRGLAGMQLLLHGERRGIAIHYSEKDGYLQAIVREAEEMPPLERRRPGVRRAAPRGAGRARRSWARSPGCRRRWSSRCWPASTSRAGSPTWWPATSTSPRSSGRPCSRPSPSRSGCAGCWCTCSGRSACSTRRRTSSRRSRRSWASGSARCSCASSSSRSARSWARTTRRDELEELKQKLDRLELPTEARKEVDRELNRLARIGRECMESQVVRTYLENVAELPWNAAHARSISISRRRSGSSTRTTTAWAT